MIPFDQIAFDLIDTLGLKADICQSEEEARQKALLLTETSTTYPIYFFGSDTSGEKSFEEFYTENEILDKESFINVGVVKNSKKRSIREIDVIFDQLHSLFESQNITKASIVNIMKVYLPNFEHIETGKGLDSKM
jgi:FlaA1/EpsC-like NDP-sugar epimerase